MWLQTAERCLLPTSKQTSSTSEQPSESPAEPCVSLGAPAFLSTGVTGEGVGVGVGAVPALSPLICRVPIRFLHSELLNTQYGSLYMPSTGALMLLTALHTCDQVRATEPPWGEGNPPLLAAVGLQRVLLAVLHVPSLQGVTEHPRQSLDPVSPHLPPHRSAPTGSSRPTTSSSQTTTTRWRRNPWCFTPTTT